MSRFFQARRLLCLSTLLALVNCMPSGEDPGIAGKELESDERPTLGVLLLFGGRPSLRSMLALVDRSPTLQRAPTQDVVENLALRWLIELPREDRPALNEALWRSIYPEQGAEVRERLGGYPVFWFGEQQTRPGQFDARSVARELCATRGERRIPRASDRGYGALKLFVAAQGNAGIDAAVSMLDVLVSPEDAEIEPRCGADELHFALVGKAPDNRSTYPNINNVLHVAQEGWEGLSSASRYSKVDFRTIPPGRDALERQAAAIRAVRNFFSARSEGLVSRVRDEDSREMRHYRGDRERCTRLTPRGLFRIRHAYGDSQTAMVQGRSLREGDWRPNWAGLGLRTVSGPSLWEYHQPDDYLYLRTPGKSGDFGAAALVEIYPDLCEYLSASSIRVPIPMHVGINTKRRQHATFTMGDVATLLRFFRGKDGYGRANARMPLEVADPLGIGKLFFHDPASRQVLDERPVARDYSLIWNQRWKSMAPVPGNIGALYFMLAAIVIGSEESLSSDTPLLRQSEGSSLSTRQRDALSVLEDIEYWVVASYRRHKNPGRNDIVIPPMDYLYRYFLQRKIRGLPDQCGGGEGKAVEEHPWGAAQVQDFVCLRPGESEDSADDLPGSASLSVDAQGCLLDAGGERIFDPNKFLPDRIRSYWYGDVRGTGGLCQRRKDAGWSQHPQLQRLMLADYDDQYECNPQNYFIRPWEEVRPKGPDEASEDNWVLRPD